MINITYLSKGKLTKGSLDKLNRLKNEVWVECLKPTKKELDDLSNQTDIPVEDFVRALDEDERPNVAEFDGYSVITFHAPCQTKNGYVTVPFNIVIKGQMIIILRRKAIESIDRLLHLDDEKKVEVLKKDITYTMYVLFSEVINHYFRVSDELEAEIDRIENNVFKYQSEKTVKKIFTLRKTLIYFHKALVGNREVISSIEKQFVKEIKGKNTKKFYYLYADALQLIDMTATYREVLSSSMDIYLTSVSNNLNEVVKRLTLIATFVLVPTLISGIYGMNFKYMPEIHAFGKWGYPFSIGLMILSILLVFIYFKRKEWI